MATLESFREQERTSDLEDSPVMRALAKAGKITMPAEWDALLHHGEDHFRTAETETAPDVVAQLAQAIVKFVDGQATIRELLAAADSEKVKRYIRIATERRSAVHKGER